MRARGLHRALGGVLVGLVGCSTSSGRETPDAGTPVVDAGGDAVDDIAVEAPDLSPPVDPGGPWPMFGHDSMHWRRGGAAGPHAGTPKWSFATAGAIQSSPAIAADGTI